MGVFMGNEKRPEVVATRLSVDEAQAILLMAREEGISISDLIRRRLFPNKSKRKLRASFPRPLDDTLPT